MRLGKAEEALVRLKKGNERYVNNLISIHSIPHSGKRESLVIAQNPFAVILSCSDSRAPSEIIFDQGLGDLFVVRVAGNVVAPSILGSIEYAVMALGVPLVVVMGHSNCGAVSAAIDAFHKGMQGMSKNISDIVDRILPAVGENIGTQDASKLTKEAFRSACIRTNVIHSVRTLINCSDLLKEKVNSGALTVIGAEYDLASGHVDFFGSDQGEQRIAVTSFQYKNVASEKFDV